MLDSSIAYSELEGPLSNLSKTRGGAYTGVGVGVGVVSTSATAKPRQTYRQDNCPELRQCVQGSAKHNHCVDFQPHINNERAPYSTVGSC